MVDFPAERKFVKIKDATGPQSPPKLMVRKIGGSTVLATLRLLEVESTKGGHWKRAAGHSFSGYLNSSPPYLTMSIRASVLLTGDDQ
jgi:hypothetical protein